MIRAHSSVGNDAAMFVRKARFMPTSLDDPSRDCRPSNGSMAVKMPASSRSDATAIADLP